MIPSARTLFITLVAFVAMEPMTYLAHRFVMHGPGLAWHRSHHSRAAGRTPQATALERNDLFPVVFATATIVLMLLGALFAPVRVLLPIGAGISLYGMTYLLVHDVYIHGRLRRGPEQRRRVRALDRLAEAHALHHRFGGEPYGMLAPVVPAPLRARARAADATHGRSVGLARPHEPARERAIAGPERT